MAIFNLANPYELPKFREFVERAAENKYVVEIKRKYPNRTLSQNAYLHTIISYFASQYGCCADEAKVLFYKRTCNKDLFLVKRTNNRGVEVECLRSTSELNTAEMSLSIERFRNWASVEADIYLPSPSEQEYLLHVQQQIENNREFI